MHEIRHFQAQSDENDIQVLSILVNSTIPDASQVSYFRRTKNSASSVSARSCALQSAASVVVLTCEMLLYYWIITQPGWLGFPIRRGIGCMLHVRLYLHETSMSLCFLLMLVEQFYTFQMCADLTFQAQSGAE